MSTDNSDHNAKEKQSKDEQLNQNGEQQTVGNDKMFFINKPFNLGSVCELPIEPIATNTNSQSDGSDSSKDDNRNRKRRRSSKYCTRKHMKQRPEPKSKDRVFKAHRKNRSTCIEKSESRAERKERKARYRNEESERSSRF
uniref:BZIP domain-containing protein n=1 Tax=Panagrellus redivivus TaxID=6233 RepID=A0A7E4WCZ5_PANRE